MKPRVFGQLFLDVGMLVGAVIAQIMWICSPVGTSRSMIRRNSKNSVLRCRGRQRPITTPVSTFSAANRVVVPCRL